MYLALAESYKENKNAISDLARIERAETHKINDEDHVLYSNKRGKILSFSDKIFEMNEMYDDLMFDLSDNSNESIRNVKEFSAEEVVKFNRRIVAKIKRNHG